MKKSKMLVILGGVLVLILLIGCGQENGEEVMIEEEEAVDHENEKAEEAVAGELNLQIFYGIWETEEGTSEDTLILDVGRVEADALSNYDEEIEYIRFGYPGSEFFPRERIIEIEERGSENACTIVTLALEEDYESGKMTVVESDEIIVYDIELLDQGRLLLTYIGAGTNTEFYFIKK